jgi:flagellar motility protein MotE (MotC chaperone)
MSGPLPSSRLLPATIGAIAVVLAIKTVGLVTALPGLGVLPSGTAQALILAGSTASAGVIAQAHAEAPAAAAASPAAAPMPTPVPEPTLAAPASAPLASTPPASTSPAGAPPASAPPAGAMLAITTPAPAPRVEPAQAATETGASMDALKLRRSQMEERERQLSLREASLAATDKRLTERVGELVALQARLQQLESGLKERDQANWTGMVKMYEGMRPRDAAAIFNALDKPVLLEVLDRMKPAKAAPVIAAMETEKARQVTADLAAKRTHATTTN